MAQAPLTPLEVERITKSLERCHVKLGAYLRSGGRAHIYRGEDALSFGRVIVRIAKKSAVISPLADDGARLRKLLDGCLQGFLVPVRPIEHEDESWNISIWEQCDDNLADTLGRYSVQDLLGHFRNLADALDYLHRNGFKRRDAPLAADQINHHVEQGTWRLAIPRREAQSRFPF